MDALLAERELKAENLFQDRRMFGRSVISQVLKELNSTSILLPQSYVPIPFSGDELHNARRLGQSLVFVPAGLSIQSIIDLSGNKTSTDTPLTTQKGEKVEGEVLRFLTTETLVGDWWLFGKLMPDSKGKNYSDQTSVIANYLPTVFGSHPPRFVQAAIEEFKVKKDGEGNTIEEKIRLQTQSAPKGAANCLSSLQINKLFRPSPIALFWFVFLCERVNHGKRILEDSLTWTNCFISMGKRRSFEPDMWPVAMGNFGQKGLNATSLNPLEAHEGVGTYFARRAWVV